MAILSSFAGCATFGRRGTASEEVASGRELTRQAVAAMQAGQWPQAEILLRQAFEASPDDAQVRRQLAETLWQRGATTEAMSHMAAAIKLEPVDAKLATRAGEMSLAVGDRQAALAHAEQAIRLEPQLSAAWALRGRVFRQINQIDRALADLQRALEFAPESGDVLMDLAVMYRERGQAARCLTTLHHLHDIGPPGSGSQSTAILEGLALMDLKRHHQAAEVFLEAAHRGPPNADLLYYLAQAQSAAGRYVEATSAAQQALVVDGSHQASRQLLAQLAEQSTPAQPQRR